MYFIMKKFIVLDIEGMSNCRPYNVGYIIGDKKGNIYKENSAALPSCIFENLQNCFHAKEMTHKNIQEILQDMENTNRKYKYNAIDELFNELIKDITENNIKEIWSYTLFDRAGLKRLFGEDKFTILENLVCFYDIIPAILYSKLLTKKYIKFCKKNDFLTAGGNISTKAEIVYRYLTGILNFQEEHTGLSDCKIEYYILLQAMRTKKKLHKGNVCAWRVLKKFCEMNNI